jgi:wyosine [tRNA(Phe)-imidazoG37] synthetase (radical SAM superfamily)
MTQLKNEISNRMADAWRRHERRWKDNRYVYAVVSRRSRGVSIGINLNPGKSCNFDCLYCQVNRSQPATVRKVDPARLANELDLIIRAEKSGSLYEDAPFNVLAREERGIRDIAFSGDGEPTTYARFEDAVRLAADARRRFDLNATRLILLTNAAYLNKPSIRAALDVMDQNNGEIWAKLDAGTEEYFRAVNRPNVSLDRILENILVTARLRPVVIQSLWFQINGVVPPVAEIEAYCSRLTGLVLEGAQIKAVQIYTTARVPAESSVTPLADDELERIASIVKARLQLPSGTIRGAHSSSI